MTIIYIALAFLGLVNILLGYFLYKNGDDVKNIYRQISSLREDDKELTSKYNKTVTAVESLSNNDVSLSEKWNDLFRLNSIASDRVEAFIIENSLDLKKIRIRLFTLENQFSKEEFVNTETSEQFLATLKGNNVILKFENRKETEHSHQFFTKWFEGTYSTLNEPK